MSLIDRFLDLLGLQRKARTVPSPEAQPTPVVEQKPESTIDSMMRQQRASVDALMLASAELATTVFDQRAEQLKRWAQELREGRLSPEGEQFIYGIFKQEGATLTPEIEQALREALEKRGREDQDPPTGESGNEEQRDGD